MAVFTNRPYAGAADLQVMISLVAARPAERITDYPGIVDLREMLGRSEMRTNTRLWEDADGQFVGFAILYVTYNKLLFEVAPQVAGGDVEAQMIAWGVERVQQVGQERSDPITLEVSCRDDNTERIALLERHGFVAQETRTLHMIRSLDEPIPEPQVPEGLVVRHVEGEHEVEPLVALHRAAFGSENITVEDRLSWMRVPGYDPELDLIAVAPDGTFAAYCMCSISEEENACTGRNEGYTDPVATHPAFRRQGLARVLLLTGFQLLKQRGVETAVLSTWGENTAMQQTAKSVGFRVQSTTVFFTKQSPRSLAHLQGRK